MRSRILRLDVGAADLVAEAERGELKFRLNHFKALGSLNILVGLICFYFEQTTIVVYTKMESLNS